MRDLAHSVDVPYRLLKRLETDVRTDPELASRVADALTRPTPLNPN